MPRIKLQGYFGWKESLKVTSTSVTAGWLAGQPFWFDSNPGDDSSAAEVKICSGAVTSAIRPRPLGIALESSADIGSASGMNIPSASKVTILHGHSKFEIDHAAEVAAGTTGAAYMAFDLGCSGSAVNDGLIVSTAGKLAPTGSTANASGSVIGMISKVPTAANNWTLGVVLFG